MGLDPVRPCVDLAHLGRLRLTVVLLTAAIFVWQKLGVPPSSLDHDPLAMLMVLGWIMVFAACLMLMITCAVEMLALMLQERTKPPVSFSQAIAYLRAHWKREK